MNRKQREKNRATARGLHFRIMRCDRCKQLGAHFVVTAPLTLADLIPGAPEREHGFYICDDLYGPDGRRIGA